MNVFAAHKNGTYRREHLALLPRSVAQQWLILLGIWLVAGIAFGDWQAIRMQRAAAIENFLVGQTNLTNGMGGQTLSALAPVDKALRDLAGALGGNPSQATDGLQAVMRSQAEFEALRNSLAPLAGTDSLTLIDATGEAEGDTRAWPFRKSDSSEAFSQQDFFRQLRNGPPGGVAVGLPRQAQASGRWSVYLARRINDSTGRFAGAVAADISLSDLEDFYRTAMPVHRTISLLRPDGTILLRFPHPARVAGRKIPAGSPFYAAAAKGGHYFEADFLDGTPVVAMSRPLRGLPLIIETQVSMNEVLAGWRAQRHWMILSGMGACAGVILLIWLFAIQLRRLASRNSELDDARRQLDLAISNVSQGICFFDRQQKLIVCNRRVGEIFNLPDWATQPGVTLAAFVDAWFSAGGPAALTREDILMSSESRESSREPRYSVIEFLDGRTVAAREQPLPDGGWVATYEDITERRHAEEQISFLAKHDSLTGLPNRSLLAERIDLARKAAGRDRVLAVLFLDLDRFKAVNDTLGHAAGDELLMEVAKRLLDTVREGDTVARLGGDEFVVLQSNLKTPEHAAVLAERIIAAIGAPYCIAGNEVLIGVSIGIDIAKGDVSKSHDLLKNADMAMYSAKSEGRGVYRFFEADMDAQVQRRHLMERDLRCALQRGEFVLHYQAIVDGRSGCACGFEALLRWNHPARGLVGPGEFIPMAEESGLIVQIGEWALGQACRDAARWPDRLHVSVNLSPVQFRAANLVAFVRETLAASGLAAERLELEVTESVLLHSNERNLAVMHELRASGIGFAMDDFGVGYSSLSYLRQFPFQRLKIDRSFVQDIATSREAASVVRAILSLCRDLGIKTTAEGVENADQLATLLADGGTYMQGYLFSRPKPASMLGALLAGGFLIVPEKGSAYSDITQAV
jgi:diguanylate cyclase (GGDEF)-like protein